MPSRSGLRKSTADAVDPPAIQIEVVYALPEGTRSLLLTLWDVHDESTAAFMSKFYLRLAHLEPKSRALQSAMQDLRYEYPHPYYWAPFILIGKSL